MAGYPPPYPAPPVMTAPQPQRPFGVLILAVLYMIQGVLMLVSAFTFTAMVGELLEFAPLFGVCTIVFIILGILYFLIGYGLYALQSWARIAAIIFAIIGLINVPIGTIISIIILIYLFKPEVKAAFGAGPPVVVAYGAPPPAYAAPPPPAYGAPPPAYAAPPPPPGGAPANCRFCGTPVPPGSMVCPRCGGRL